MAKILMALFACMFVVAPYAEGAITCSEVISSIAPCLGYLRNGGAVPAPCCIGVTRLNNAASSTPDRQTACGCLKGVYASNSGINLSNAGSLPAKCGVNIPYKFSPAIDCSKIH